MAHEVVTVCLSADAHQDLHADIEEAMAPFDCNGGHEPYRGEWDTWWLGRPGDEFDVLPGHEDDPRLVRGQWDARGKPRPQGPGQCDSACWISTPCAAAPLNWPRISTPTAPASSLTG